MEEIRIGKNDSGQRADKFLKKFLSKAPAGFIYKMVRKKKIKLNKCRMMPSEILKEGDTIQFYFAPETLKKFIPKIQVTETGMDFNIAYQDKNILVVDKPAGLLSHSDREKEETLIDQVIYYLYRSGEYNPYSEKSFVPALCNRLDRNTGGLVLAAKNFSALQDMNYMIKEKWVEKYYITVVAGKMDSEKYVQGFLVKDKSTNRVKIINHPAEGCKEIKTSFTPVKYSDRGYTMLNVQLITGKPHQIRAHLAYTGYPLVGDNKYGNRKVNEFFKNIYNLRYQLLYANRITFKNTTPIFEYLRGKTITHEPPIELIKIIKDIFPHI